MKNLFNFIYVWAGFVLFLLFGQVLLSAYELTNDWYYASGITFLGIFAVFYWFTGINDGRS